MEEGDFISVAVTATPAVPLALDPAIVIYNDLGEIVYTSDNMFVDVNTAIFIASLNVDTLFEVPDDGDYFVMVTSAARPGFLFPTNPFDPASGITSLSAGGYTATIGVNTLDIDYFAVDLEAGDIVGVNSRGRVNDVQLVAPNGTVLVGSNQSLTDFVPEESPIPRGGVASFAYVAPRTGTYHIRVMNSGFSLLSELPLVGPAPGNYTLDGQDRGPGNYEVQARLFRPQLEQSPIGTHQILFLDFDGETINTNFWDPDFGGPRTLSPMADFLSGAGISSFQESEVIDAILEAVNEDFRELGFRGNNGDFIRTGRNGDYRIEIRNSRDHADPFGLPNVSRVVIGGSSDEIAIPGFYGIAQTVDVGNFDTEETAVVLMDGFTGPAFFLGFVDLDLDGQPDDLDGDGQPDAVDVPDEGSVNHYLTARGMTQIDLLARAVGNVTVHEAGHYFGAYHTGEELIDIMDQGGSPANLYEAGPDRILGTQDDTDIDFAVDEYVPNEGFTGAEDTVNTLAFGLSTGIGRNGSGGGGSGANGVDRSRMARGFVWHDRNENGSIEVDEPGLHDIIVYADENNNKVFDIGEPASRTDSSGNYRITDINRAKTQIRIVLDPGLIPTSPEDGSHDFVRGEPTVNKNFGVKAGDGTDEGFDYASAPAPYPTAGVRHGVVPGLSLGSTIDGESGPQSNDDADGVRFLNDVYAGGRSTVEVTINNGDQPGALLHAWIDFDGDGTWSTPGEQVISNLKMSEGTRTISFNVPTWAINAPSVARFRYGYEPDLSFTGASIAGEVEDYNINIEQTGPEATADSYEFRRNSGEHRLFVLNNDSFRGGNVTIDSVTSPSDGGSVTIDRSSATLIYEAAPNYSGTETFTYTIMDSNGLTDSATVSVTTTMDFVTIRLVATDADSNPITRASLGSEFLLQAYVQDLREEASGVHAAFLDVNYSSVLADPIGTISYGDDYPNARSGNIDPGAFDEIGAIAALDRLDGNERLLFSVPMEATAEGTVNFIGSPADFMPAHDILLFDVNTPIPTSRVEYRPYSLTISEGTVVSTATNPVNAMDVNDDDDVSPIDALLVINDLNGQDAARRAGANHYLDVNADGSISPIDALLVINYLNRPTALAASANVAAAIDGSSSPEASKLSVAPQTKLPETSTTSPKETIESNEVNESLFVNKVSDRDRSDAIASILDEIDESELF